MTKRKATQSSIDPIVDRLFWDLRREKELLAQKKDIDGSLKAVRRSMALGIAELHARSGVVSVDFEKTDYACGCIVICGQVWRDCKTPVVEPYRSTAPLITKGSIRAEADKTKEKAKPAACDRRKET